MRSGSPQHLSDGNPEKFDGGGLLLPSEIVDRGAMDFSALFGNDQPVEVEIGSGKGTFLLARASARPEVNFLGIEWARAYALYCADRFRRAGLTNVRVLRTDAVPFVSQCIPDGSLARLHIYFPDPWPKRRHHLRRSIQLPFLNTIRRKLRVGGQLLIVTDHLGYFQHIERALSAARGWASTGFPQMSDESGQVVGTNFERKYIAQGRSVYKAARLKLSDYPGRAIF